MDERQRTIGRCEQHGSPLYLLGCAITDDPGIAADAVARAIAQAPPGSPDPATGEDGLLRRDLGRQVYLDCVALAPPSNVRPRHPVPPEATASSLPTMEWLWELPAQQRASIALCAFGGHTYREAAALLSLTAADVAGLLRSACRAATHDPPLPHEHLPEPSPPTPIPSGGDPAENPRKAALTNNTGGDV